MNNAVATRMAAGAKKEDAIAAAKDSIAQMTHTAVIQKGTAAIKAQAAAWLSSPLGIITAIAVGVYALYKVIDLTTTSTSEWADKLSKAKSEISEVSSTIDGLNSQLEETRSKIAELQGLGALSFADQNELDALKEENSELQRQLDLQKQIKAEKDKEAQKDFTGWVKSNYENGSEYSSLYKFQLDMNGNPMQDASGAMTPKIESEKEYISEVIQKRKELQTQIADIEKQILASTDESKKKELKSTESTLERQSDDYSKYLAGVQSDILEQQGNLEYVENPQTEAQKSYNAELDKTNNLLDKIAIASAAPGDKSSALTNAFNRISDKKQFSGIVDEIENVGKSVDLTDVKYQVFIQALIDCGFISDNSAASLAGVKDQIFNVGSSSESTTTSLTALSTVLANLSGAKDDISKLATIFKNLSENGAAGFDAINAIATSDTFKNLPNLDTYLAALLKAKGNTAEVSGILSDLTYTALDAKLSTEGLANATEDSVAAFLKETGVANADEVAIYSIKSAKEKLAIETAIANGTLDYFISNLSNEAMEAGLTKGALALLAAQEVATSNTALNFSQQIAALKELAEQAFGAAAGMSSVFSMNSVNSEVRTAIQHGDMTLKEAQEYATNQALNKIKDLAASSVPQVSYAGATTGSGGGGDSKEYLATLDKTYLAKKKLAEIQKEITALETQSDMTDDPQKKLNYLNQTVVLLKKQQEALHEINEINRSSINSNIDTLTAKGFDISYDSANNNFVVNNMEHINELGKDERKTYEDLISATEDLNKANEDNSASWLDISKSLSEVNAKYDDIKASALDAYQKTIDAIQAQIDKEKEALEVRKQSYEDQKEAYETTVKYVVSSIQDQIDALQDQNDTLDKQLEVEQKLEALEKAKTQKNKKVFVEGQGFVWKADQSAVNSTQSDYDELIRKNNLDAQIEKLQKYSDLWQNVVDGYQEGIDEATASGILTSFLGSDWLTALSNMDTSVLDDLTSYYSSTSQQLDEDVSGSVANQIKNLEELSDEWDNSSKQIKTAAEGYTTTLSDVKAFEALSYSERLAQIKSFTAEAINALNALATAEAAAGSSKTVTVQSDGNAQAGLNSGDTVKSADGKSAWTIVDAGTSGATYNPNSGYWSVKKYSDGGVVDYTGVAQVHGGSAAEMVLNNADVGKVYDFIHNSDSIAERLISQANIGKVNSLSSDIKPNQVQSFSLSIGDINIEHADDADSLAADIKKRFPNIMKQEFYKNK